MHVFSWALYGRLSAHMAVVHIFCSFLFVEFFLRAGTQLSPIPPHLSREDLSSQMFGVVEELLSLVWSLSCCSAGPTLVGLSFIIYWSQALRITVLYSTLLGLLMEGWGRSWDWTFQKVDWNVLPKTHRLCKNQLWRYLAFAPSLLFSPQVLVIFR